MSIIMLYLAFAMKSCYIEAALVLSVVMIARHIRAAHKTKEVTTVSPTTVALIVASGKLQV